jgi:hypothetical protein
VIEVASRCLVLGPIGEAPIELSRDDHGAWSTTALRGALRGGVRG